MNNVMNWKEGGRGMWLCGLHGGFGGRKGKQEIRQLHYKLKIFLKIALFLIMCVHMCTFT